MSIKEEGKRASRETPASTEALKQPKPESRLIPASEIRDVRVRLIVDFMQANLHRKISLDDLGREVHLSAAHISRLFPIETGIPAGEYLIRLRMEKARHLLSKSLLSIREIMAVTGYGNRGHFLEHFRRYFGLAPSEYRNRVQLRNEKRRPAPRKS